MAADLKDRVVIVTGGSRGIGRAISVAFAQERCSVIVNYKTSQQHAESIESTIKETGGSCLLVQEDISTKEGRYLLLKRTLEKYGKIDVLVNNAGIRYNGSFEDALQCDLENILRINLVGPLLLAIDAAEEMRERGGHVLNISSAAGIIPRKGKGMFYGMTKAALNYVTAALARQYAPSVRINAIAPGYTQTDLLTEGHGGELEKIKEAIPLKKINSPEDVAQAALFLQKAQNITGHVLVVDGGSSL